MTDNVRWLTTEPAYDRNFKHSLEQATVGELKEAISILAGKREGDNIPRIFVISREIRERGRTDE